MYMNKKNVLKKLFQTKIKCNFIRDITLFWITFMQAYSAIGNLIKCIAISVIMFTLQSKVIGLDYFMLLLSFFIIKTGSLITEEVCCTYQIHFYQVFTFLSSREVQINCTNYWRNMLQLQKDKRRNFSLATHQLKSKSFKKKYCGGLFFMKHNCPFNL